MALCPFSIGSPKHAKKKQKKEEEEEGALVLSCHKGTDSVQCIFRAAMDVALYVIAAAVLIVLILFAVKVRRQTRAGRTASLRSAAAVGPLPGCRHAAVTGCSFQTLFGR